MRTRAKVRAGAGVTLLLLVVAVAEAAEAAETAETAETSEAGETAPQPEDSLAITRKLSEQTLNAGDQLKLRCEASVTTLKPTTRLKVRWMKNEVQINNRSRIETRRSSTNTSVTSTLRIRSVTIHDMGFYECVVSEGRKQVSSSAVVKVIDTEDDFPAAGLDPLFSAETEPQLELRLHNDTQPLPTLCQQYVGAACSKFLQNQSVYIPYPATQTALEQKLTRAFSVISYSNEISSNCESYAQPSLCFSTFPICQTPDETNFQFLQHLKNAKDPRDNSIKKISRITDSDDISTRIFFDNLPPGGLPPHLNPSATPFFDTNVTPQLRYTEPDVEFHIDTKTKTVVREELPTRFERQAQFTQQPTEEFSMSRAAIPLRRVCREDCEILENELCQKEYAIAKRHPEIGQKLILEECINLPFDASDCLEIGIERHSGSADTCYWETGLDYTGHVNVANSGLPCIKWSHQFIYKMTDNPELAGGHSYCRNPGGIEIQPWCFIEKGSKIEKQFCDVPKCSKRIWIYIISVIAGLTTLFSLCIVYICLRHQNSKNNTAAIRNINLPNADKNIYGNSRLNSPIELTDLLNGQGSLGNNSGSRTNRILRVPHYSLSQIKFVEELGEGAFGKVFKGELNRGADAIFVAVKALKENASPKTQSDFRREIELISELRHDNIVCILGVVLREEPLCMLFEFMAKGDLHEFLVSKAPPGGSGLTSSQFLSIAHHIAAGMEYLAAHHYVHRDLAARNCLVADSLVVKISDFGLSRDIYSSDYYRVQSKSLLPVRWMPPESILYGKFTTESDVWSYGVVLWEIYSYGLQPYYGYSNQEVISMVRGRELLQCPSECPRALFNLMRECWHQTPARRPNFTLISNRLSEWIQSSVIVHGGDNTSESSGALSGQRPPHSLGDPRERIPLISHHSSSNGSLSGTIPRKLSAAGSNRSHASTRLMVSSSDVTSSSDNCETSAKVKKLSCGSLLDGQPSNISGERRDVPMMPTLTQPYAF
ncbi:tyrosine-protein kinase transmembrane receptor Ror [Arctopsyche grandis]|uniref:tyrosine-protein kinase transmembrane receptor Ror n=1 Tax=Arctopsyche grandis TaxID=121162 RepID=UPI00406D7E4C